MCGIVGVLSTKGTRRHTADVSRMMDAIVHRGPDDQGLAEAEGVTLGFRRLSIIDLAAGHQPMQSADQRYTIIFNGEIYNFRELRDELILSHQCRFATRSDTEVILQAYTVWRNDTFQRLNGMFALAIWDDAEKRLTIARDRAGKKPLFYQRTADAFQFASEIKCFLELEDFKPLPAIDRIAASLAYRYVPRYENLFAGIDCLPPAHYAVIEPDHALEINPVSYWKPRPLPVNSSSISGLKSDTVAVGKLAELLRQSVWRRLVADVPVGAFLSGGVDSSIIVALMSEQVGAKLNTFSIGFDTGQSEHINARAVAEKFGTSHHETIVSGADLLKEIPAVLWSRESPISEPSDIPLFMLSREARKKVTVVLSGEGSDELFAGYPKYVASYYLETMPCKLLRPLLPVVAKVASIQGNSSPAGLALASLTETDVMDANARWFGAFGSAERSELLSRELAVLADIHAYARSLDQNYRSASILTRMQLQDFHHWLPANLLLRGDRVTMAHSLELRCPFLDPDIIDFAVSDMSDNMKIRGGTSKWIVRKVAASLLPPEVSRRKKWGFKVPVTEWFRGPLKDSLKEILLSSRARKRGYFQMPYIEKLINEHTGRGANHSKQLWYLYQLELWHLMFIDGVLKPDDTL